MKPVTMGRVPSFSAAGHAYTITRYASGLGCDCPAFAHSKDKHCKHLAIYEAARHALERCFMHGGGDGTHLCQQCLLDLVAAMARRVRQAYEPKKPKPKKGVK